MLKTCPLNVILLVGIMSIYVDSANAAEWFEWSTHASCAGAYQTGAHNGPIVSDISENLDLLVFSYGDTNQTDDSETITINNSVERTHSWSVGGEVSAQIKTGMLTRVVADAKVGVSVNGQYSGSGTKTYTISRNITVPGCSAKIRREYIDDYAAGAYQMTTTSGYWYCPVHNLESYSSPHVCNGNGDGDNNLHGVTADGGPYSQSTNPCADCYQEP